MSVSARHRRLQPWQVLTACLLAVVLALGLAGGGVLGVWQGLSENATNMVTAAAASAVAVHSVHCSGLTPAYPTSCTDAQHWVAETQLIALMVWVVPEVCAVQVVPPLVVATMVPLAPTAQPSLALAN